MPRWWRLARATRLPKAAEEAATYDARFARLGGDMLVLKWMSGTTLALVVAVLLKLFVH